MRTTVSLAFAVLAVLLPVPAFAQSSSPGVGIDVEIVNPADGSNSFTVAPDDTFWAYVFVRPGSGSVVCELDCGQGPRSMTGGSGAIVAAVIDIAFDQALLEYLQSENNPLTAAVDGLVQEHNLEQGRIGWALAGDWTPDADPTSGSLASPCDMARLTTAGWVLRVKFRARPEASGTTALHIRRETDTNPFPLSFADVCGSPAFKKSNQQIDEVIDATVVVTSEAPSRLRRGGERHEADEP